ncbi:RodZ domain-containing protein [Rheinheimera sp. FR7-31]|uniref:RodZ domain-containing protein n=1 Tax=Rheinheimera fenheensis TaxID=3152295 RepID=UPI00325C9535
MSQQQTEQLTAGQLLRAAREQRKLSQQQVALQLNLRPDIINQLEQDQLEGTLETFARGYVRAYGRLLKLPEAELMAAFGRHTGLEKSHAKPMRTFSNRTARQATENRFMWLTYAIVALLLVLLFIWWWQSDITTSSQTATQASTAQPVDDTAAVAAPGITEGQTHSDATLAELAADSSTSDSSVLDLSEAADAEISAPTAPEQLSAELDQLMPVVGDTSGDTQAPPVVAGEMAQLEMRFSENCWIDVVDATGSRVAFGTKQAGYIMQLSGVAPFTITLGNPSVVSISLNQQVVDMAGFPAGRVAKFTLPE